MRESDNLQPKLITDFTPEDTVYIQVSTQSGKNTTTYLCNFVKYERGKVYGTKVLEMHNKIPNHTIGEEISAPLVKCGLYGINPTSGRTYYHWFKSSGYAIYPNEYNLDKEDADIIKEHPSFGLVGISRRSSRGLNLFGSSILHNEVIAITISQAEVDRQLNREWYHSKGELIEIELSANQFAEFITTPNVGSGVPCTIRYLNKNRVPDPPYESVIDRYSDEFKVKMENNSKRLSDGIETVKAIFEKNSVTKKDKEEILNIFEKFIQEVKSNVPFIEKSFVEQMDKVVTEAKAEIESFVTRRITEEGRKVLLGETGEVKMIKGKDEER